MEPILSPPQEAETVLFRPSKKRKIYRQRGLDEETSPSSPPLCQGQTSNPSLAPAATDHVYPEPDEIEGTNVPISEILRLRKLRKQRVGGVEF